MFIKILALVAGLILLAFVLDAIHRGSIRRARESGLYPPEGQATLDDVERLVRTGHKMLAIKLYRQLHGVDLKTAKEVVEQMAAEWGSPPR